MKKEFVYFDRQRTPTWEQHIRRGVFNACVAWFSSRSFNKTYSDHQGIWQKFILIFYDLPEILVVLEVNVASETEN